MATIRLAIIEQMKQQFDQTVFSRHMFKVEANKSENILNIKFQGKEGYSFVLKEVTPPKQNRFKFVTIESPGQISNETEEFDHENLNNAQSRAYQWAHRIQEDYKIAVPDESDLESFREEFLKNFEKQDIDDSHFSPEEQDSVTEKMKVFEKKLEKLYKDKEATNQQLHAMRQQIDILKKSVEILDKRTWLSAACNRIFDIYKEVKGAKNEVSGLIGEMSKLLPSPEAEVADEASE